jgi:hypothetical protein
MTQPYYKNDGALDFSLQFNSLQQAVDSLGDWYIYHEELHMIVRLDDAKPDSIPAQQALRYLEETHGIHCVDALE